MINNKHKLYFLMGFDRSGASLVRNILNNHPEVATTPDLGIFDEIFSNKKSIEHRLTLINFMIQKRSNDIERLRIDPRELRRKMIEASTEKEMLKIFIETFASKTDYKMLVEKTAGHSRYIDKITEMFPEAGIIYVIRDGREVVASMKKACRLEKKQFVISLVRWIISAKMFLRYASKTSYLFVRYEDVVGKSQETFSKIFQDLGISFSPEYLQSVSGNSAFDDVPQDGIYKSEHYQSLFSKKERMFIEYYMRTLLEFYGYDREFEKYKVPIFWRVSFWWAYLKSYIYFNLKRRGLESLYSRYRQNIKDPLKDFFTKETKETIKAYE